MKKNFKTYYHSGVLYPEKDILNHIPNDCKYHIQFTLSATLMLLTAGSVICQSSWDYLSYLELYEFKLDSDLEFSFEVKEKGIFLFFVLGDFMKFCLPDKTLIADVYGPTAFATFNSAGKYCCKLKKGISHLIYIHPRTDWLRRQITGFRGLPEFLNWMDSESHLFGDMPQVKIEKKPLCELLKELAALGSKQIEDLEIAKAIIVKKIWKQYLELVSVKMDSPLYKTWHFIRSNYSDRELTNLDKLSHLYPFSSKTMIRDYKKEFHVSPASHVRRLRMEKGMRLIEKGQCVHETAIAVGFSNTASFSKAFKLHFGKPPSSVYE